MLPAPETILNGSNRITIGEDQAASFRNRERTMRGEIVRLGKPANPHEAEQWRFALEANAIRCRVVGDYLSGVVGEIPPADGLLEVWVASDDLDRAKSIVEAARPGNR
jgi:hypothetical protein